MFVHPEAKAKPTPLSDIGDQRSPAPLIECKPHNTGPLPGDSSQSPWSSIPGTTWVHFLPGLKSSREIPCWRLLFCYLAQSCPSCLPSTGSTDEGWQWRIWSAAPATRREPASKDWQWRGGRCHLSYIRWALSQIKNGAEAALLPSSSMSVQGSPSKSRPPFRASMRV